MTVAQRSQPSAKGLSDFGDGKAPPDRQRPRENYGIKAEYFRDSPEDPGNRRDKRSNATEIIP